MAITNHDIVLDPDGYLQPGQIHDIPFDLNEADVGVDAVLMSEAALSGLFRWTLRTPAGDIIDPTNPAVDFVAADNLSFYRMTLPVPIGAGAHSGTWHALLTLDERLYKRYLSVLADKNPTQYQHVLAHGIRYSLNVQSFSGLRLAARVTQNSLEPGATITLRARLTEYGTPVESDRAAVKTELTRPDGSSTVLHLVHIEPGIYSVDIPAALPGVYRMRVLANGFTLRARPFTREHLLTGATWRNGNEPPPHTDPPKDDDPCHLLGCLFNERVITPELERRLMEWGVDLGALRKCLERCCTSQQQVRESISTGPTQAGPAVISNLNIQANQLAEIARHVIEELQPRR